MADTLLKVRIEKIAAGGAGLARTGGSDIAPGKTVFIEGSAPDETILCRITEEHHFWLQAELLEVIEPSQKRVAPVCGFYGRCGGCNLQHLNCSAQLAAKTAILTEAFTRIGGFCPPQPLIFPSEPWEYRNRMQFHAVRGMNPSSVRQYNKEESGGLWGLKARKKGDIIPVSDCPIADPGIRAVLQGKDGSIQTQFLAPDKDRFTVYARHGLLLSDNGTKRGKTPVLDREFTLDTEVFFQSNGSMLEKLVMDLKEIADRADRTLPMADLYCGVGTFAAFLGEMFPHIDLVEENKTALTLARENLRQLSSLDIKSAAFFAQPCEQWAKNSASRRYGFICIDPPRHGFDPALTQWLVVNGPPLLAYISCDPATLARDSALLFKGGYTLAELRFYDFYPQTAHIESLALFTKP